MFFSWPPRVYLHFSLKNEQLEIVSVSQPNLNENKRERKEEKFGKHEWHRVYFDSCMPPESLPLDIVFYIFDENERIRLNQRQP